MVLNMLVVKLLNEDGLCLKEVEEKNPNLENVLHVVMLNVDVKNVDANVVKKEVIKDLLKSPCVKKVDF
jgi:hypothetical protein